MSEQCRNLNSNAVSALADSDFIVCCDASGTLRPISRADFFRGIRVGGRNLIKNSNPYMTVANYHIGDFYFGVDKPQHGDVIILTLWGDFSNINGVSVFNSGGFVYVGYLSKRGNNMASGVFEWKTVNASGNSANSTFVALYQDSATSNANVRIDRLMMQFGNVASDWSPAPEDLNPNWGG